MDEEMLRRLEPIRERRGAERRQNRNPHSPVPLPLWIEGGRGRSKVKLLGHKKCLKKKTLFVFGSGMRQSVTASF